MRLLFDPAVWASLLTLTSLEIVLGVDNIVVLSILTSRLPRHQAHRARSVGLALALVLRILLLSAISTIIQLTTPLFSAGGLSFSWRDLILIAGGLFLIFKATQEIHSEIEGRYEDPFEPAAKVRFAAVISQIAVMDLIFSLDSIVTAVGLAQDIEVMAAAVCIAVGIMYFAANVTADFIERHPTLKMLALAFLILIGAVLVADGFGAHVPRVYIYFAMGFAGLVEALNIWAKTTASKAEGSHASRRTSRHAPPGRRAQTATANESSPKKIPLRAAPPAAHKKAGRKRARRK
jgi:predicted tellurium resistance membrane protein TerC